LKIVLPLNISFIYPRWETAAPELWEWGAPVSFALLLAGLFLGRARLGRAPFAGLAFFCVTLIPALGFIDIVPFIYSFVADHFQYLAGIGLFVLLAGLGTSLAARISPVGQRLALTAAIVLICSCAALSYRHARDFRNEETLWRSTIERNPSAWMAWENLIAMLNRDHRYTEAIAVGERGLQHHPKRAVLLVSMGIALQNSGRLDEAAGRFGEAAAINPDWAMVQFHLGSSMLALGRPSEALTAFNRALEIDPKMGIAHMMRGNALLNARRFEEAVAAYRRALDIMPNHALTWFSLGVAHTAQGEFEAAEGAYRRALEINNREFDARLNLGIVLANQGRLDEASVEFERIMHEASGTEIADRAGQAQAEIRAARGR
jgi:protein O-mannosyl-transferase